MLSRLTPYADEIMGDHQCKFWCNTSTDQIFCIRQIPVEKWQYNEALYIYFKKAYVSVRRKVSHNILIKFGIAIKLAGLIKMCLNETYGKVQVSKHLSDSFLLRMVWNNVLTIAFQLCSWVCHQESSGKSGWLEIMWFTSAFSLCWWC